MGMLNFWSRQSLIRLLVFNKLSRRIVRQPSNYAGFTLAVFDYYYMSLMFNFEISTGLKAYRPQNQLKKCGRPPAPVKHGTCRENKKGKKGRIRNLMNH